MKKKIPIAIIGKNFGYNVLAKSLKKTNRFIIKALSFKSNKFKNNSSLNIFFSSKWKDVVKDKEIKAVVIASPPAMHEKIINFAIKHKKHIFCEKPCSLNLKKIDKIIKKIKSKNFFISHMVNYEMMELKAFKYFSSLIRKKKFKINSIEVEWNVLNRTKPNSWKNYHKNGGGLMFNYYCHSLFYIEKMFGKINSLKRITDFNLNKKNNDLRVILELKDNIFCSIKISSNKLLRKKELFHKLIVYTNQGNYLIKCKTINISDQFCIEKVITSKNKVVIKQIFNEKKSSNDFRILPSYFNFIKFADSIDRKKIITPNFLDAKNIHLLIKKTIQS
tara:strand:+ start:759 stop:1757 length:999 start_codon:yes stop_codon:yes gene_type:complete